MFFELNGQINTVLCCVFFIKNVRFNSSIQTFIQIHTIMGNGHWNDKNDTPWTFQFFPAMNYRASLCYVCTQMYSKSEHEKGLFYQTIHIQHTEWPIWKVKPPPPWQRRYHTHKQTNQNQIINWPKYMLLYLLMLSLSMPIFIYRLLLINI